MDYVPIKKNNINQLDVKPNFLNLQKIRDTFAWEDLDKELNGIEGGGFNISYEILDRHNLTPIKDKIALYWEGKNEETETFTFSDLSKLTNRFANVLTNLGINKGDRIFTYMDRIPELYISLLGILKVGGVMGPLFSAFGPDAVKDRLGDCEARVLITTSILVPTVHEILKDLPALETIIIVNKKGTDYDFKKNEVNYEDLMKGASEEFDIEKTDREDYAIIHYTSGTTGKPKGVVHAHQAILGHYATAICP